MEISISKVKIYDGLCGQCGGCVPVCSSELLLKNPSLLGLARYMVAGRCVQVFTFFASFDFILAALFAWITPFRAALSSALAAALRLAGFFSGSFSVCTALIAPRKAAFTGRFLWRAFSAVFIRFAADLCLGNQVSFPINSGQTHI